MIRYTELGPRLPPLRPRIMSLAELQLGLPGQLDLRGIVWLPPHVEPLLPSRADRIAAHAAVGRAALDWARDAAAANPRAARAATAAMAAAAMAVAGREMYYTMWPPPRPPDSTATLPDEVLADILAMLDERSALAAAMVNPRWRRVCRLLVTVSVTPGLFGSPHFWGLGRLGKQPPDKLSAAEADARLLSFTSKRGGGSRQAAPPVAHLAGCHGHRCGVPVCMESRSVGATPHRVGCAR